MVDGRLAISAEELHALDSAVEKPSDDAKVELHDKNVNVPAKEWQKKGTSQGPV